MYLFYEANEVSIHIVPNAFTCWAIDFNYITKPCMMTLCHRAIWIVKYIVNYFLSLIVDISGATFCFGELTTWPITMLL